MNHPFTRSQIDAEKCAKCHRAEIDHGKLATCEACPNVGNCELLGTRLLCHECLKKEYDAGVAYSKQHSAEWEKINIENVTNPIGAILKSVEIDNALQISTDYFNAETQSIVALATAVKASQVDNPEFEVAKLLQIRYQLFKKTLFEIDEARLNIHSRHKAQAQALNELAGKLSAEQRESLKLKDLTYTPAEPPKKPISKPKLSFEDKMAQNMIAIKLRKTAEELVKNGECANIEEGEKVAQARGLVMSLDEARRAVAKAFGKSA